MLLAVSQLTEKEYRLYVTKGGQNVSGAERGQVN